ncbi:hypothetical protein [Allocoleopsis sp.]|uniref:hypothetical protein n=1 Tax=Allocoleopsis sp. TaxID=3088169 RepID=UPI002FD51247
MGDKEQLVKTIADTLKKELTIDAPPQRVTSSVNTRKTRSRPVPVTTGYNTVFLLDGNIWDDSSTLFFNNPAYIKETFKGNIEFLQGVFKTLGADKSKKIYTGTGTTFLGTPLPATGNPLLNSQFLKDYVLSPLGIELKSITSNELESIDSVFWMPFFQYDWFNVNQEILKFSDTDIKVLTAKAKKYGLILQGELGFYYMANNYYLQNFYKQTDWRFTTYYYLQNWISVDKPSKGAVVKTASGSGIPVSELKDKRHAIATFDFQGTSYAGAIAWRML